MECRSCLMLSYFITWWQFINICCANIAICCQFAITSSAKFITCCQFAIIFCQLAIICGPNPLICSQFVIIFSGNFVMANFVMCKLRYVQTSLCANFVMCKLRHVQTLLCANFVMCKLRYVQTSFPVLNLCSRLVPLPPIYFIFGVKRV